MLRWERCTALKPLIEACRPHAKVPPRHLRRTMVAIIWRHENGAKWRAIPAQYGPWWIAAYMPCEVADAFATALGRPVEEAEHSTGWIAHL
jgi:transposase